VKGESPADLHKQKVVIVGAGSAGTGVAQMLMNGKCLISFNGRFSTWFMVQIVIVQIVQMVQLDYGCAFFKTLSDAERRGGREAWLCLVFTHFFFSVHSLSFFSPSVSVNGFEGMVQQGLTEDEAKAMFYLVDENGLLSQVRSYVCFKVFINLLVPSCFCF
jgi:hypothetical protein